MGENNFLEQAVGRARTTLQELLRLMGFEAQITAAPQGENEILLNIESPEAARLIGRQAQVLDAIQFLVNRMVLIKEDKSLHCIVDIERYRERRNQKLLQEASAAVERVLQSGQPVRLSPMGAADRRIIHQALKDNPRVRTQSEEVGGAGLKCVVVSPADP